MARKIENMNQTTRNRIGNTMLTIALILGILIFHTTAGATQLTPIEPGCHERGGFTYCNP